MNERATPPPRGPRTPPGEGAAAEERQSLWLLAASPTIWMAHFLVCYVGAAVWCARVVGRGGALGPVRPAIGVLTLAALAGIAATFWVGLRRQRHREAGRKVADNGRVAAPPRDGGRDPEDAEASLPRGASAGPGEVRDHNSAIQGAQAHPHEADTPPARHRFLGFATLLLSGLSAVAVLYTAAVAAFVETCR